MKSKNKGKPSSQELKKTLRHGESIFILALIIKIGLFLSLLTPLIIGPFSYSFSDYPQVFFFRTIITICFISYLILLSLTRYYLPTRSFIVIAIVLYISSLILSTLFGFNIHRSFWGSLEHVFGLITYVYYGLFFWLLVSFYKTPKQWVAVFRVITGVSFISSSLAIAQILGYIKLYNVETYRVSGTLSNPDYFSQFLVLVIGITVFLIYLEQRTLLKWIWTVVTILNVIALILSGSRGAWIGLLVGVAVFVALFFSFVQKRGVMHRKSLIRLALCGALGVLIAQLLIWTTPIIRNNPFVQRYESLYVIDQLLKDSSRFVNWKMALQGFRDSPIFGFGPLSYGYLFEKYLDSEYLKYWKENLIFYHPHNTALEVMSAGGIIGLISYMSIFVSVIWAMRKKIQTSLGITIIALVAAYFVHSLSLFDTPSGFLVFITVVAFAHVFAKSDEAHEEAVSSVHQHLSIPFALVSAVVSLIILITWYHANLKPILATQYLLKGIKFERQDFNKALLLYKQAASKHTMYDKELKYVVINRGLAAIQTNNKSPRKEDILKELMLYKEFLETERGNADINPMTPYEYLARIYEYEYKGGSKQALSDMERILMDAITRFPERPRFYQLLGKAKIYQGSREEGVSYLLKNFKMRQHYDIKDWISFYTEAGIILYDAGVKDEALKYFSTLIQLAYTENHINPLPLNRDPRTTYSDALNFKNIAMLFALQGDSENARDIISRAIIIYPEHKAWLEKALKEIAP